MRYAILFTMLVFVMYGCSSTNAPRPYTVNNEKIESRFLYATDRAAIEGILKDIVEVEVKDVLRYGFFNVSSSTQWTLIGYYRMRMYEEDGEIGKWFKSKFGSEVRNGEAIKFIYTYKDKRAGFDFIYRPYNKDIFSQDLVSSSDFILVLEKIAREEYDSDEW